LVASVVSLCSRGKQLKAMSEALKRCGGHGAEIAMTALERRLKTECGS